MRSYPFLIVIGLTIFLGYACVPAASSGYEVFQLGGVRGIYNSNWLGGMGTMISSLLLWLFGFYMLRSQVSDDQRLGVGQLIAASPISKFQYIFSKTISNFVVLVVIEIVFIIAFIIMQFIRGEDFSFQLGGYVYPLLYIVFPSLALLASLTTFFDVFPGLKGVVGNIIFFFLWVLLGIMAMEQPNDYWDVFGLNVIGSDMFQDAASKFEFLSRGEENRSFGYYPIEGQMQTFQWDGVDWTSDILITRFIWFGITLLLIWLTSLVFHRFGTSSRGEKKINELRQDNELIAVSEHNTELFTLTSITRTKGVSMLRLVKAELSIMLKGFTIWWYAIAIGLIAFGLICPVDISKGWLPIIMIWPIAIWSQMATREQFYRTNQIIYSSCSPFYMFFATWISGIIVGLIISSGIIIQFILIEDISFLLSWLSGIVFISTLALTLGVWSRTRKLFEVLYMLWWYLGPVNSLSYLDFLGVSTSYFILYAAMSIVLLCIAIIGQQQQAGRLRLIFK
ncbi:hypothetical protein AZF08_23540 [Bacillus gaemokensis]|nr:hypothetical protein AZF08_23540 [Bacillus gaemokensis]